MLDKVRHLKAHYDAGLVAQLHQHEVHPDLDPSSRENYLYFTLPVCINFQRSSPAMWQAALATYDDPETRYVFFPEQLATTSLETIRRDLLKHKLALQPNKHVAIWTTIARTFHDYYHDDPRELIEEAHSDAAELITLLQVTHRDRFPYLRGAKLSNYWPYILSQYTDVLFAHSESISIIPDTHVIQASIVLGLVEVGASPLEVELAWRELLTGSDIATTTMHPILWNWSRAHFQPTV